MSRAVGTATRAASVSDSAAGDEGIPLENPRRKARTLISDDDSNFQELWLRYWANGGEAEAFEFEAYLYGIVELRAFEDEILAHALEDLQTPRNRGWRYY